jgi:hypothetical protein
MIQRDHSAQARLLRVKAQGIDLGRGPLSTPGSLTSSPSLKDASSQGRAHAQSPGNPVRLLWLEKSHDVIQTLPTNTIRQTFQLLFRKEFCEENVDRLHGELLEMKQETSVGEYATRLRRTLSVVPLPVEEQIGHFLRGLKPELFIVACAAEPKTLEEAIKAARRAERAYVPVREERAAGHIESGNVRAWSSNPENEQANEGGGSKFGLTDGKSPRKTGHEETKSHGKGGESVCPRCLQDGHFVKGCDREPKAEWHACCQYLRKHRRGCRQQQKGNPGLVKAVEKR